VIRKIKHNMWLAWMYIEYAYLHAKLYAFHFRHGADGIGDTHILMAMAGNKILREVLTDHLIADLLEVSSKRG
jgi:hypothetical protein